MPRTIAELMAVVAELSVCLAALRRGSVAEVLIAAFSLSLIWTALAAIRLADSQDRSTDTP